MHFGSDWSNPSRAVKYSTLSLGSPCATNNEDQRSITICNVLFRTLSLGPNVWPGPAAGWGVRCASVASQALLCRTDHECWGTQNPEAKMSSEQELKSHEAWSLYILINFPFYNQLKDSTCNISVLHSQICSLDFLLEHPHVACFGSEWRTQPARVKQNANVWCAILTNPANSDLYLYFLMTGSTLDCIS